jgi:uncharacterized protein YjbJ (UPF0337 family)
MGESTGKVTEVAGKVTEVTGRVTGDREVEAKGRVEQQAADPSEPVNDVTEHEIEEETEDVRRNHLDIPDET